MSGGSGGRRPHPTAATFDFQKEVVTVETDSLTKSIASTCGCFVTYSVIFPFSIQSKTTSNGGGTSVGTPRRGTTLGCFNHFHNTTSAQNIYRPKGLSNRSTITNDGRTDLVYGIVYGTDYLQEAWFQNLDTNFPPTEFRCVYASQSSDRKWLLPTQKLFSRNEAR